MKLIIIEDVMMIMTAGTSRTTSIKKGVDCGDLLIHK